MCTCVYGVAFIRCCHHSSVKMVCWGAGGTNALQVVCLEHSETEVLLSHYIFEFLANNQSLLLIGIAGGTFAFILNAVAIDSCGARSSCPEMLWSPVLEKALCSVLSILPAPFLWWFILLYRVDTDLWLVQKIVQLYTHSEYAKLHPHIST